MRFPLRSALLALAATVAVALAPACASSGEKKDDASAAEAKDDSAPAGLAAAKSPEEGVYIMGQIDAADLDAAKERGVSIVVNLRLADEGGFWAEEQQEVESRGMTYVHLPVKKPNVADHGLIRANAEMLALLLEDAEGGVLVHCGSGNRAGGLAALTKQPKGAMNADEAAAYLDAAGVTSQKVKDIVQAAFAAEDATTVDDATSDAAADTGGDEG